MFVFTLGAPWAAGLDPVGAPGLKVVTGYLYPDLSKSLFAASVL